MITDEIKIKVEAGKGGNGVVGFDKNKMAIGPTGGKGGIGGNVYFQGVSNLTALNKFKHQKEYFAENGKDGKNDKSTGRDGVDLFLNIPVGSVVKNLQTNQEFEITDVNQKVLAAKGGIGGRGNFYFRSPVNTSPEESEEGKLGETFEYFIELRLIADIGLIGLPNVGKSSLLNELTKADVKVANYEFTTLEPNLGVMGEVIIADIPGLIEGASIGKGLGIKFLKHIRRTKVLFHCISAESEDVEKNYQIIRKELQAFSPELNEKKEIVFLTKVDAVSPEIVAEKKKVLQKINPQVEAISIHDWDSLEKVRKVIEGVVK